MAGTKAAAIDPIRAVNAGPASLAGAKVDIEPDPARPSRVQQLRSRALAEGRLLGLLASKGYFVHSLSLFFVHLLPFTNQGSYGLSPLPPLQS
jgi:hypothetical protein